VRLSAESAGWVLEQLTALQGAARSGGGRAVTRDELLRQRVFAFQVQQGLDLDGLAGPITLMQLNRASGIDEPQLQPER
jgi:general secretion pathway protein A